MARYEISPAAGEDLIAIWVYISENAADKQADNMIDKIEQQCQNLALNPAMGRMRPELKSGLRSFQSIPTSFFMIALPLTRLSYGVCFIKVGILTRY